MVSPQLFAADAIGWARIAKDDLEKYVEEDAGAEAVKDLPNIYAVLHTQLQEERSGSHTRQAYVEALFPEGSPSRMTQEEVLDTTASLAAFTKRVLNPGKRHEVTEAEAAFAVARADDVLTALEDAYENTPLYA